MLFYFRMSFLCNWNKFDYNEVAVTILTQRNLLALKHWIYINQDSSFTFYQYRVKMIFFLLKPLFKDASPASYEK